MTQTTLDRKTDEIHQLVVQANEKLVVLWKNEMLFTWRWWVGVILFIIPWLLWIKYRKKDSTGRLLFAGFSALIISSYLDALGIAFGKWHYYYKVLPCLPAYLPWDFTLVPVAVMACIQCKPHWHPLIKAVLFAAFTAFVAIPFFTWIQLYDPEEWKAIYSFFIYIAIYLIAHYLTTLNSTAPLIKQKVHE